MNGIQLIQALTDLYRTDKALASLPVEIEASPSIEVEYVSVYRDREGTARYVYLS